MEQQFSEECLVDFDFRLIDIFKRMSEQGRKIEELIKEEYFRVKTYLNHRPSRMELFAYINEELYTNIKSKAKLNKFNDYIGFLNSIKN